MTAKYEKIVPDTSVIIEGIVSLKLKNKEIQVDEIIIHEAVLAELEHQANEGRAGGFIGMDEMDKLRADYADKLKYAGKRPTLNEVKFASLGEIDASIRQLAYEEQAALMTSDKVQSRIAKAHGMQVIFIPKEKGIRTLKLESFFDELTMSVHLRENTRPVAKKGGPGNWKFVTLTDKFMEQEEIKEISREIIEETGIRADGFMEIEREGSTIIQLGNYRIVITRPPFSDGWEITAVRPVKKLNLSEYKLSAQLMERISTHAEGMLIAGAPGQGKSTFAQALAEYYAKQNKIVKTVEAPRDMVLPETITQYSLSKGSPEEIHDILLLSRPDYTIFDEMRNTKDFQLFADMRLSGVGMVGVIHGTKPIDSIQRFVGRVELGVIPQVIDTVIFIKDGTVNKVLQVKMTVKVPAGMTEADLARPVVEVKDFETGKPAFELYSYGEETVCVPVEEQQAKGGMHSLAADSIRREFLKYSDKVEVDVISANKAIVKVPEYAIGGIIGKQGKHIEEIEKELGISIDVQEMQGFPGKKNKKKRR